MRNPGQILIGVLIVLAGFAALISAVFDVDASLICWPTGLIVVGLWLLVRASRVQPDTNLRVASFGPIRRDGAWEVKNQEIWLALGDVRLDLTKADIPEGETLIRVNAFISNVRLWVPEGVGVEISSLAFISSLKAWGKKQDSFIAPIRMVSEGFDAAARKVRVEATCFIGEVKVVSA